MKKNNLFKIATMLSSFALTITTLSKIPDSFLFWGEPTPTLDELENK